MRPIARSALLLVAVGLVAPACSALSGLDGLEFVRDTTTSAPTASGGAGGQASAGGAGGRGGTASQGGGTPTGSGGAAGSGGSTGGAGPCKDPSVDCPAPGTDCRTAVCGPGGQCGVDVVAAGVPTAAQTLGDCLEVRCDGEGGTQSVPADDPSNDDKECTVDACSGGQSVHAPKPLRAPCSQGGGSLCDLVGDCVACVDWTDCKGGACKGGACQPPACGDGVVPQGEACDDGDALGGDGCSATCMVETGYVCSGQPSACTPKCGDGLLVGGETCDDGNAVGGDCCSASCQIEAGCEIEPNNSKAAANDLDALAVGGKVKGHIVPDSDVDFFSVMMPVGAGGQLTAEVLDGGKSICAANALDSYLTVYGPSGSIVGIDDDSGPGYCSALTLKGLPLGKYTVAVKRSLIQGTFDYTLHVTVQ